MYRAQGVSPEDADTVARILMGNPDVALDTHARLELGVDPEDPGSSWQAAAVSLSPSPSEPFSRSCLVFTGGTVAVVASVVIGASASVALGAAIGSFSAQGVWRTAGRNCWLPSWRRP